MFESIQEGLDSQVKVEQHCNTALLQQLCAGALVRTSTVIEMLFLHMVLNACGVSQRLQDIVDTNITVTCAGLLSQGSLALALFISQSTTITVTY
jgi:hypothetical protein